MLVARFACDFPFVDAFVDFLAVDFAAVDFELPFELLEPERDFELLRLFAVFFCVVWAILTLLSGWNPSDAPPTHA